MIRLLLTALVTLTALLVPMDPAAGETRHPEVRWPLAAPVLRVENRTDGGWQIRSVLREIERRTPVDVRRGRCRDRATEVCVIVREGDWDPEEQREIHDLGFEWAGIAVVSTKIRRVYLNNHYRYESTRQVTAHEFGHVLGLDHHTRRWGVVGAVPREHFSRAEIRRLRETYAGRDYQK